jgi:hypothetical protein
MAVSVVLTLLFKLQNPALYRIGDAVFRANLPRAR